MTYLRGVTIFFGLFLLNSPLTTAQSSSKPSTSSSKPTVAAAKCHKLLAEFAGKDLSYFGGKTDEELTDIDLTIDDCLRNSYSQLSRFDLSLAGIVAAIVSRQLQWRIDQSSYDALQKSYNDLLAKVTPSASSSKTVTLTISPLPNGYTRTIPVRGGVLFTCMAIESMQLECIRDDPNTMPVRLIAMIATPKPLRPYEHSFLIGCNPSLSGNCFSLVPGDYPAEYVGVDGVSVGGLVAEDKPDAPPHHATFVIYKKGEMP